ncbi:MAG: DUF1501 domain-containing protein [Myxococcales bacterium]|nr:MAG: DUF1501 domain-containing protein [Myxococcales bacterium]
MKRRDFLKLLGAAGISVMCPPGLRAARGQIAGYDGPLYCSIAAEGGWDVTSFCDPKTNVPGNPQINHWAQSDTVRTITGSEIRYAPFANNESFFQRFHGDMLVVNGVDTQTNSHDAGVRHSWSGRLAPGYPSFAALAAAAYGQGLPLSFINNGGYRETAGIVNYSRVSNPSVLRSLAQPNGVPWGGGDVHNDTDELAVIRAHADDRNAALLAREDLLPRERRAVESMAGALADSTQLEALAAVLPEQFPEPIDRDGNYNGLLQQIEIALLCYTAGLTVSCDLVSWGFDSHTDHDSEQAMSLSLLTNGVEYLWDRAAELGIADRLILCMSSDFGRTPEYNDDDGKDHWPIGSTIFMQQNAPWGDRVVGLTDDGHNAIAIDPTTLDPDPGGGIVIQPKHVQDAFRRLGGIDLDATTQSFPLLAEPLDIFNPAL